MRIALHGACWLALSHSAQRCAQEETARRLRSDVLEPTDLDDLLHCTMVPWVRFTGIKHARPGTPGDSVPKIAVGRATQTAEGVRMPMAVDGHHALMDGVHVGAFRGARWSVRGCLS